MRHRLAHGLAAAILLAAIASVPSRAAESAAPDLPAVADACQSCHGRDGISTVAATPNLAGQKAAYLTAQLKAFKAGERKSDLMKAIAAQLSDADMQGLAQYWSSRPAAPVEGHAAEARVLASRMGFPANFPADFTRFKVDGGDEAMTERYANSVAIRAAKAGQPLPDGSVLLAVNHAVTKDASGAAVMGAVTSYTGMEARAGWGAAIPALLRNGNWDYALFTADKSPRKINQAQCLACHKPIADSYVFNIKALRAAATK